MPTFGFSSTTGYVSPTLDTLREYVRDLHFAETGVLVDLSINSPDRGVIYTMARQLKALYDDGAGTYASGFVASAAGASLQNLLSPFIGAPLPDSYSQVSLPTAGTGGVVVPAGSAVTLDSDGASAANWVLLADTTIPNAGTWAYSIAGPKTAAASSTWTIATPVAGWTGVGPNAADAAKGRLAETEAEYRQRYSASIEGRRLVASVLGADGVTAAYVFENPTDVPDAFWGATHWVELLVQGGAAADIAAAIQANRAFTVQTLGTVTETVDAPGFPSDQVDIKFSRPNEIDVWVDMTITKGEGYPGDTSSAAVDGRVTAITDQVLAWAELRRVGLDLTSFQVAAIAAQTPSVPGIGSITCTIGTSSPPTGSDITAGPRDLLVFDAARITIAGA